MEELLARPPVDDCMGAGLSKARGAIHFEVRVKRSDPLADAASLLERIETHERWQPQTLQGSMSLRLVELAAGVVGRAGNAATLEGGESSCPQETLELIADALAALWARLETGSLPEPPFSPERIVA